MINVIDCVKHCKYQMLKKLLAHTANPTDFLTGPKVDCLKS